MKPLIQQSFTISTLLATTLLIPTMASEYPVPIHPCPRHHHADIPYIESMNNQRIISQGVGSKFILKVAPNTHSVILEEEIKKSRFEEDIQTAQEIAKNLILSPLHKEMGANIDQCVSYVQKIERASVTLTTTSEEEENSTKSSRYHFIAEPEDHFYLSANLPITTVRELHYDEENGQFIEKEQPSSFYLGFNYKIGDLYTKYGPNQFYKNLSLKAMTKFTEHPTESLGVGVGYHFNEYIELFVARVWTEDDKSVDRANLGHTPTTTYGVSFNLSKALAWIRGDASY